MEVMNDSTNSDLVNQFQRELEGVMNIARKYDELFVGVAQGPFMFCKEIQTTLGSSPEKFSL